MIEKMTAKEKANELIDRHMDYGFLGFEQRKKIASKFVDHILCIDIGFREFHEAEVFYKFWEQVKIEIEKL